MNCITCRRDLAPRLFGKSPNLAKGKDPRCKQCIREQAKLSIRTYKSLPRFETLIRRWPDVQLESEAAYLRRKLELLHSERDRRNLKP